MNLIDFSIHELKYRVLSDEIKGWMTLNQSSLVEIEQVSYYVMVQCNVLHIAIILQ